MVPAPLTIALQSVAAVALLASGALALQRQPANRIRRALFVYALLCSLGLLVDAAGRIVLYEASALTDLYFRLAEPLLAIGAAAFVYLSAVFPRRAAPRKTDRLLRKTRLFRLGLLFAGGALAISLGSWSPFYVNQRSYDPGPGTYYGSYGLAYWLDRAWLVLCCLAAIREQRRFLAHHDRDVRRVHSRYFAISAATVAFVGAAAWALALRGLENEAMALLALALAGFSIFLHNLLENLHLNISARLSRLLAAALAYLLGLAPLLYAIRALLSRLEDSPTLWKAAALATLFGAYHFAVRAAGPLLARLLFRREAQTEMRVAEFNSRILRLERSSRNQIRAQLADFFQDLYRPRFLALYSLESEESDRPQLLLDRSRARAIDVHSLPPEKFPPAALRLLSGISASAFSPGALAADLLAAAERIDDPRAIDAITSLALCGAEAVIPFYQDEAEYLSGAPPRLLAMLGMCESGRPLNHGDLAWLALLRTPTLLALRNQELLTTTAELKERLEEENRKITSRLNRNLIPISSVDSAAAIIYQRDGQLARLIAQAERFAAEDAPILITGETGTGKGAIARMIHAVSQRNGRFVTVNCSALPADLIENELFGHERGAYTGAVEASEGLAARAADGALFFDEIGELPANGQTKLLRLVQNGEYERIGSNETLRCSCRFLFATNRNLEEEVKAGRFRLDLFYRISAFELHVPPLRERPEDIVLLADHFLWNAARKTGREGMKISPEALALLQRYRWPGNVRELENLILRSMALSDGDRIDVDQLPVVFRDELDFERKRNQLERMQFDRERLERELLLEALQRSGGNQREAARILKISRGSLQYRMKQYGLA
ncbi:MAG: sigma 54-interacting transcriptional regulator [Leptospirales bacterium]|nr:sigma 54-interacting transcriptional regulator [Leptospirales bacterium]